MAGWSCVTSFGKYSKRERRDKREGFRTFLHPSWKLKLEKIVLTSYSLWIPLRWQKRRMSPCLEQKDQKVQSLSCSEPVCPSHLLLTLGYKEQAVIGSKTKDSLWWIWVQHAGLIPLLNGTHWWTAFGLVGSHLEYKAKVGSIHEFGLLLRRSWTLIISVLLCGFWTKSEWERKTWKSCNAVYVTPDIIAVKQN